MDALDRLAALAATLLGCQSATLILTERGLSRVVACHGAPYALRSFHNDGTGLPFEPNASFLVEDLDARPEVREKLMLAWMEPTRFFYRTPVVSGSGRSLTLIVTDPQPHPAPATVELELLEEIINLIRAEFELVKYMLVDPQAHVTVALPMVGIIERAAISRFAVAILDASLKITYVNDAAAVLAGAAKTDMVNINFSSFLGTAGDALVLTLRQALALKISTPPIEFTTIGSSGKPRSFRVIASPFSPIGTDEYFLQLEICEMTSLNALEDALEVRVSRAAAKQQSQPEPTAQFLLETLVQRRALRARNGITYLSLRSWRGPIREYQIKALVALKTQPSPGFVDHIAREIELEVASLIGIAAFGAIVPVPCGHSDGKTCLSLAIAKRLGERLNLPVLLPLAAKKLKGKSHPRTNIQRPPLTLLFEVEHSILLVDDVATSGLHLEEAVKLLRPKAGAVLPVAWIGGNAVAKDDHGPLQD